MDGPDPTDGWMDGWRESNKRVAQQRSDNTFHYIPPAGLMAVFGYWRKENKNIKRIKRKFYANNIQPIDPTATPKIYSKELKKKKKKKERDRES